MSLDILNWTNNCLSSLLLIPTVFCATAVDAQQVSYTVTDLGSLEGPSGSSFAGGINNRGEVAATSLPATGTEAFLWLKGEVTPLPTLGGSFSEAFGINAAGQAVGRADLTGDLVHRATLWEKATITDLGTLGGTNSEALSVNNAHQIVGDAETGIGTSAGQISHAFLFENAVMLDLGTLGGDNSFASYINGRGEATGQSDTTIVLDPKFGIPDFHGFIVQQFGPLVDFGEILGGKFNYGSGINNRGQIVGSADLAGDQTAHAFIWQNGSVEDLGTLPGDTSSGAFNLNDHGEAVGISALAASGFGLPPVSIFLCPCHAALWEHEEVIDLNSRIPTSSGWELFIATAINEGGQIIGQGLLNNGSNFRAFLLTPRNGPAEVPNAEAGGTLPLGLSLHGSKMQPQGLLVRRAKAGRVVLERR